MKNTMKTILGLALFATPLVAGCSSNDNTGVPTTPTPTPAAGSAFLRVAHLSPNAPAVDFCIQIAGGTFTGPTLTNLGLARGLTYPQVSRYITIPEGTYTVRLVAPNAADCNTSLDGTADFTLPALNSGTYATAAAIGLVGGNPAFTVKPFMDDFTSPAGLAGFRFIQAAPGTPAVDVGVLVAPVPGGAATLFTPVFTNVTFANTGTGTGVDANGYIASPPLTNATLSGRPSGSAQDAVVIPGVSIAAGSTATAFAIGLAGNATTPLQVLLCGDNAAPTGNLATCRIAP